MKVAEVSIPEDISQKLLTAVGKDKLQAASKRQLQLMDQMLVRRLQNKPDPVTEMELLGMYEMITEEVLPVSLPI